MQKHFIKQAVKWLAIGLIASTAAHFLIEWYHFNFNFDHVIDQITQVRPELFLYGTLIIFVLYTLLSSLLGSSVTAGTIVLFLGWLLGISTNLKAGNFR